MRILLFLLLTFVIACNPAEIEENSSKEIQEEKEPEIIVPETYEALDIEATNKKLLEMKDSLSPKEIMGLYYPLELENSEGKQKIDVTEKTLDNGEIEVELIHSNLLDDSMLAEKHIMLLKNIKGKWAVISIKKNWKCRKNRGHEYWGVRKCK